MPRLPDLWPLSSPQEPKEIGKIKAQPKVTEPAGEGRDGLGSQGSP